MAGQPKPLSSAAKFKQVTTAVSPTYPAQSLPQFGVVGNYDGVKLLSVLLPITLGSLKGGSKYDVEKRKSSGADFASYKGQGLDTEPVSFQLNLFRDLASGKNWLREYEKIKDKLTPKKFEARNAIAIYHPSLAGDNITQIVVTNRGLLIPAGPERWTVEIVGYDVRFVGPSKGSKSKEVDQTRQLLQEGAVQKVVGPEKKLKGSAAKTFPALTTANR